MKIETVRTDSFTMDYCRFGSGKDTLVILPGLAVQSVMGAGDAIAAAYRALAEDFTVYLFDRRSELPPDYSIRDMAADTAAAMQALRLGPVCLFGASQGGMIAMVIAAEYPALVRRLVLGSTTARAAGEELRLFERWIALAEEGEAAALYHAFGQAVYPPEVYEQLREQFSNAAGSVTAEELRRFVTLAGAVRGFDVLEELGRIRCPVLVMGANDDRVVGGEASRRIAERLKDSALCMYDGYGHAAYDLAPDYKERMLCFLKA